MRDILTIGHHDLRVFLRHRSSFIWLVLVPLVFVYFMGFANRGPGSPANPRPPVLVDNADPGFLGQAFLDELGAQGLNVVAPTNAGSAPRGVRIPADFTTNILAGGQGRVQFFALESSADAASALVEIRLARALIALNSHLLEHATTTTGAPPTAEALAALRAQQNPVVLDSRFAGRRPIPTGFNFSLPGVLVMYLMMNLLIFGGSALSNERRTGLLRRILVHPVTRLRLLAGKLYGLLLLGLVQIVCLLLAGRFLFRVDLGDHLAGIFLVLMVYAWVAASLGLLIGSVIRADDKVIGLCLLISLVMAALGGCWWPLEVVPESVQFIAHCIPTGWALDALHQLITFGAGLPAAREEISVLTLFAVTAHLAAARFFRV